MKPSKYMITAFLTAFTAVLLSAQLAEGSDLYSTLKAKDSILFNAAFNSCDTEVVKALFTEDFEFYHDQSGVTMGRVNFLAPMEQACAQRNVGDLQPAKRILLDGSLKVYPLYDKGRLYGAIQHGIHRFEFLNDKKAYQKGAIAKFTHLWVVQDDVWKIKRELSYDHQPSE